MDRFGSCCTQDGLYVSVPLDRMNSDAPTTVLLQLQVKENCMVTIPKTRLPSRSCRKILCYLTLSCFAVNRTDRFRQPRCMQEMSGATRGRRICTRDAFKSKAEQERGWNDDAGVLDGRTEINASRSVLQDAGLGPCRVCRFVPTSWNFSRDAE